MKNKNYVLYTVLTGNKKTQHFRNMVFGIRWSQRNPKGKSVEIIADGGHELHTH